jgi:hypothetical protein
MNMVPRFRSFIGLVEEIYAQGHEADLETLQLAYLRDLLSNNMRRLHWQQERETV